MHRFLLPVLRLSRTVRSQIIIPKAISIEHYQANHYSTALKTFHQPITLNGFINPQSSSCNLLSQCKKLLVPTLQSTVIPSRPVTKFSLQKGKRKSVKAVIKRFKRLDWGIWIRTHCGRHKKLYKKSSALKRRLRQHIFVNATQSWLLDKMVTKFWKRPKYYVDDPYAPYHSREDFPITRKTPKY